MMQTLRPRCLPPRAALAVAVLSAAAASPPAVAASAVGHVSVTILPAAAGVGGGGMSFGAAGSATGPSSSAGVTVTGAPGTPVTFTVSAGNAAHGPGRPILFQVIATSPGTLPTIDRSGVLRLALGATLAIGRQQAPGAYRGQCTVTVDY